MTGIRSFLHLRHFKYLFFAFTILCTHDLISQEDDEKKWYKGNLHTHSFWSDGNDFPEMIMSWYKERDYQFVALTDHNILAEGEKWIGIAEDSLYRNAFGRYLEKYGEDWINHKEDSGRLSVQLKTLEEYRPLFEEEEKFLIIKGQEITNRYENKHLHLNATNLQEVIKPQNGSSVVDILQKSIDALHKQRQETNQPMIIHVNHPNFHYSISLEDMIALKGERFFEVFNGHPQVHNLGDADHIGVEEMWDLVNIAYLKKDKPLIFGLATDDSHNYHRKGKTWSNAGRGWIMVRATALTPEALIASLEKGDYYSSTGVTLNRLEYKNNRIKIGIESEKDVNYQIQFIGGEKGEKKTKVLKQSKGTSSSFKLKPGLQFVRVKITSTKLHDNPIEDILYEMAWTQPVQYMP